RVWLILACCSGCRGRALYRDRDRAACRDVAQVAVQRVRRDRVGARTCSRGRRLPNESTVAWQHVIQRDVVCNAPGLAVVTYYDAVGELRSRRKRAGLRGLDDLQMRHGNFGNEQGTAVIATDDLAGAIRLRM